MQATQTKRFGWSAASGEAAKLVRAHDWASTPLGPIDEWPQSLRLPVSLILDSPLAMIVLWGPELIQVYNDGYRVILNHLHPRAMGQPTQECWPEVWEFNRPLYEAVFRGQCRSFVDQKLTIWRTGVAEDAWFDLTYSPLRNEDDSVGGVLITVVEVTERHMSEAASRASEAHLRIVLEGIGEEAVRESVMRQAFLLQFSDALRPIACRTTSMPRSPRAWGCAWSTSWSGSCGVPSASSAMRARSSRCASLQSTIARTDQVLDDPSKRRV